MPTPVPDDDRYFALIRDALVVCQRYRPMFGNGRKGGLSVTEFQTLYRQDPFYTWFGLDSPLVYAAHKAAGGITSLYRQIGISCERLFRQILKDSLGLTDEQAEWSYHVPVTGGKQRLLSLDGRIPIAEIVDRTKAYRVTAWTQEAARAVGVASNIIATLRGPVFEVRQGYKSKDSKRQNADVGNAANAYLPVVVLLSIQIDSDIAERYSRAQWVLLRGSTSGTSLTSTYAFSREVLGYDLAGFFERNSSRIRTEVDVVVEALLR